MEQAKAQSTSSLNKHRKKAEKDKEYSTNDISINIPERMVTAKQEKKLKEYKQECFRNRIQDLETTRNITYKKKGKAKQSDASAIQGKEHCEILAVMLQILARLNKLEEQQENKKRNGAGCDLEIRKLRKAIKDINRVFQKLKKKVKLIDPRNKENLKMIQELYKTNLNIQLDTIKINNPEHTTKLKKCGSCYMNEDLDTAVEHCILWRQLRNKKRALQNNWVKKTEGTNEFLLEVPLESIMRKRYRMQNIADILPIDSSQMPIIKIATCEEELINIYLKESQAEKKLKSIAGQIREENPGQIGNDARCNFKEESTKSCDLTVKEKKAKDITQNLVNLAQSRFIGHIWKFRYKEKQITQLEAIGVNSQLEQRTQKARRRVNKENQDPLRE
ncbi:6247_t:CDS:2, partial [Gigaspora margarita]